MNDQMQNGMTEATRLTQQGRLEEATAAIQCALGGTYVPTTKPGFSGDTIGPIDVTSRIVKEDPVSGSGVTASGVRPFIGPTRLLGPPHRGTCSPTAWRV